MNIIDDFILFVIASKNLLIISLVLLFVLALILRFCIEARAKELWLKLTIFGYLLSVIGLICAALSLEEEFLKGRMAVTQGKLKSEYQLAETFARQQLDTLMTIDRNTISNDAVRPYDEIRDYLLKADEILRAGYDSHRWIMFLDQTKTPYTQLSLFYHDKSGAPQQLIGNYLTNEILAHMSWVSSYENKDKQLKSEYLELTGEAYEYKDDGITKPYFIKIVWPYLVLLILIIQIGKAWAELLVLGELKK